MKKKISLILAVVMFAITLGGCNFIVRDLDKDFAREVITINSKVLPTFKFDKPVYDEFGILTNETQSKEYNYTTPKVSIYKSQLNNYLNNMLGEKLNAGVDPKNGLETAIDEIIDTVIEVELSIIEADRLFYAGEIRWTHQDIDQIQRSVYSSINSGILSIKNSLLASKDKAEITEPTDQQTPTEPTYPTKPVEEVNETVRPSYFYPIDGEFRWYYNEPANPTYLWHDDWYTQSDWYIQDESKYLTSYPGMFGSDDERSLGKEALNRFFDNIVNNFEVYTTAKLIDATSQQIEAVNQEVEQLKQIKETKGIQYIYPLLGKTLLCKFMYGDTALRSAKSTKLQNYVYDQVTVSEFEVETEYNRLLSAQKSAFQNYTSYDSAVNNKDIILFTPSSRYVFVKHILLQFSPEQKQMLEVERERVGATDTENEQAVQLFNQYREQLTQSILVYDRVNGEDNTSSPAKSPNQVFAEVKAGMERYKNSPYYAERAFDDYIYAYNDDPGIFNNRYGYAVIYDPLPTDAEGWREEFAQGARDFRANGYSVGQILDNYVITDEGIHIMYFAADPKSFEEKKLTDYTTAGQYESIYDSIESRILSSKQTNAYDLYFASYISKTKNQNWTTKSDKIIEEFKKDLRKQIYG